MDAESKAALLKQVDFFASCSEAQLLDIAKLVGDLHLSPGEALCEQGDIGTDVFVLVDGEAKVTIDGIDRATVGTGEVVGELSEETGGKRTATLTATTALHVLVLDPREVDSVLMTDPKSVRNLGPRRPG